MDPIRQGFGKQVANYIFLFLFSNITQLKGSVLGPLLFITCMNTPKYFKSILFADNTTILYSSENVTLIFNRRGYDLKLLAYCHECLLDQRYNTC